MHTRTELLDLAAELERHARALFSAARRLSGNPVARATNELARSVAYLMIALRRLAESGIAAWDAIDSRLPPDPEDPPPDPSKSPDPLAELVAELDVITCLLAGDMILEDLAYAELVRRGEVPKWTPGERKMPSMWPPLMMLLDAAPIDSMTESARYLDVTLAHARDVLVAHRDPTVHYIPSFTNWGEVTLARATVDPDRETEAAKRLRAVAEEIKYLPHGMDGSILLDHLVALSPRLDKQQREAIRSAYRYAGFESPPLGDMMRRVSRLISLHLEGLDRIPAEPVSEPASADASPGDR